MEQIGAFWNASRCQPQVLRESLQAGPASADAIEDKSKTGRQGIMQRGATNEHQNVNLWSISCKLRPNRLPMNSRVPLCIFVHFRLSPPVHGASGSRAPAQRLYKTNFSPVLDKRVVEKSRENRSSGNHQRP